MAEKEVPTLEWFVGRVQALRDLNKARNDMYDEIDNMDARVWTLPKDLEDLGWIIKVTEAAFAQVLKAVSRILSGRKPRFSMTPIKPSEQDSTDLADRLEKALEWIFDRASRRRPATILEDNTMSASKYGEVCAQVTYLPVQIKSVDAAKGNTNRLRAMKRRSDFIIDLYDPRDVYPRYSTAGLEEVALVTREDPEHLYQLYGDAAKELEMKIEMWNADEGNARHKITTVTKVDYVSWDWHCVYATMEIDPTVGRRSVAASIEIIRQKWAWPFLPWACRIGGTSLEEDEDRKRRPLLYDQYRGEEWEIACRVKTLRYSDMMRYALSPRRAFTSDAREQPKVDETSPDLTTHLGVDESLVTLQPVTPDPNMSVLYSELLGSIEKSTLSSILLGGEGIPQGVAFATINTVTHSAMGAVRPIQHLVEMSLADIAELCLLWVKYSGIETVAYGRDKEGNAKEYMIKPEDVDPDNLYIAVEIEADLPTDRQARAATSGMLIDRGIIRRRSAMEDMGIRNTKEEEDGIIAERLMDAHLAAEVDNIRFYESEQMRQRMMQEAMMMIQQQMAQQQAQQQAQQRAQQQQSRATTGTGVAEPGTPGNMPPQQMMPPTGVPEEANPAEGGPVPAEFAPGATREMQGGGGAMMP